MRTGRELRVQQRLIRDDGRREGLRQGITQGEQQATDAVLAYLAIQTTDAKVTQQLITDIKAGKHMDVEATPVDAVPVDTVPVDPAPVPVPMPVVEGVDSP